MESNSQAFSFTWGTLSFLVTGSSIVGGIVVKVLERFFPFLDSYWAERGRISAQSNKIDALIASTEKLTTTTETIKAKLSDETWDKQQRKTKRSERYEDLIEKLHAVIEATIPLRASFHILANYALPEQQQSEAEKERDQAAEALLAALSEFGRAKQIACLVCGNDPLRILLTLQSPAFNSSKPKEAEGILEDFGKRALTAFHGFIMAVRLELGYEPLGNALS